MARLFAASVCLASLTAAVTPAGPKAPADVAIEVAVRAPLRASYDPSVAGAKKPALGVVVTNRSPSPIDVSKLRVHLDARRKGVAFRCADEVGAELGAREPTTLAPGASFEFERALDCALPLVGAYAVRVAVSFGDGSYATPREVHAFNLTVTARPNVAPREIAGVPGLWAAMGSASAMTSPSGHGIGRMVLTIVNATNKPIGVPPMHLVLRVYRVGNPVPCQDEPLVVHTPPVLGPGAVHSEPLEVSCLGLSVAGTYEVAARLVEGDRQIALGRLRVNVVTNPTLFLTPWADMWRWP